MSDSFFGALRALDAHSRQDALLQHAIPIDSNLTSVPAGSRDNTQERSKALSRQISKARRLVLSLISITQKAAHNSQPQKDLRGASPGIVYGRPIRDASLFRNNYGLHQKRNGGVTDMLYITVPWRCGRRNFGRPEGIPTKPQRRTYSSARYRTVRKQPLQSGLPSRKRRSMSLLDVIHTFPVSSFIYTLRFNSDKHTVSMVSKSEISKFLSIHINPTDFTRAARDLVLGPLPSPWVFRF